MHPTDSRPASAVWTRTPVEPPTHGAQRGGHHAVFRSRVLAAGIPRNASDPVTIDCPKCRATGASVDRVGATVYGSHDRIAQCGWVDTLTIGRDPHGAVTLT